MDLILHLAALSVFVLLVIAGAYALFLWRGKPIQEGLVPLNYVPYSNERTFYRRDDGLLYQRIGKHLQIQIVILRNGDVHKLGKPTEINPNELVKIEKIEQV